MKKVFAICIMVIAVVLVVWSGAYQYDPGDGDGTYDPRVYEKKFITCNYFTQTFRVECQYGLLLEDCTGHGCSE